MDFFLREAIPGENQGSTEFFKNFYNTPENLSKLIISCPLTRFVHKRGLDCVIALPKDSF